MCAVQLLLSKSLVCVAFTNQLFNKLFLLVSHSLFLFHFVSHFLKVLKPEEEDMSWLMSFRAMVFWARASVTA